jgi:hypothetical protein
LTDLKIGHYKCLLRLLLDGLKPVGYITLRLAAYGLVLLTGTPA